MHLGTLIARFREEERMSMDEFASRSGLSKAYISMLERNVNSRSGKPIVPSLETIKAVSGAIGVDFNAVISIIDPDTKVTIREPSRLSLTIRDTVQIMRTLDDEGQMIVHNTAEGLHASGKYDRPEAIELVTEAQALYTLGTAAAGSGFYNEDYIENYRLIMTTEIPEHDFTLDVEGNSMFPAILDGDVVFVRKEFDRIDNKIYVLDIDGETVVKRVVFETDKIILRSDNPEWDDREVTGYALEHTRIEGIVVGWETPE